ncbi:uncharacterized protein EHS24_006396 [Apiotrichum porosum]|uniref:C2H2-type domain-containing protein n=1 Tax=Apiotrichum porosum TaxID=105984 RepID=A0A427Y125_9TREE|nr:uncharacterized protein EHS24_006396 [Apiotrichum porosum]RSH84864.1 hypothetical protein EHS24_006396 [Apiotrichum porosum]
MPTPDQCIKILRSTHDLPCQDELNRKWKPNSEFYKVFILELWSLKEFNFVTATDDQLRLAYATTILAESVFMDIYNCYIKHATAQANPKLLVMHRLFRCPEPGCGTSWVSLSSFKRHYARDAHITGFHDDVRAFYSCDWLGGDGESYDPVDHIKGQLKCHVKSMHKNEHNFYCWEDDCHRGFQKEYFREKHFFVDHAGIPVEDIHREFEREMCASTYDTSSGLKEHEKAAHMAHEHVCSYCDSGFPTCAKLRRHLSIHERSHSVYCLVETFMIPFDSVMNRTRHINEWYTAVLIPRMPTRPIIPQ